MTMPWEDYAAEESGPWDNYKSDTGKSKPWAAKVKLSDKPKDTRKVSYTDSGYRPNKPATTLKEFAKNAVQDIVELPMFPVRALEGLANAPDTGTAALEMGKGLITTPLGFIPGISDMATGRSAGENWRTNPGMGALTVAGAATLAKPVIKGGVKKAINAVPESFERSMYERSMKAQGLNALKPEVIKSRIDTALNEGIPISEAGLEKINTTIQGINHEIKARVQQYADAGYTVSKNAVMDKVGEVRAKAATKAFPEKAVRDVNKTAAEFDRNNMPASIDPATNIATDTQIPFDVAHSKKVDINRDLAEFYEATKRSPDKTAYFARQWVNRTKAAIGDGFREVMGEIAPELKPRLAREGGLLELKKNYERALNRIGQRDVLSLKFLQAFATNPKMAIVEYLVNNPKIQSNIAVAIRQTRNKANSKTQVPPMPDSPIAPISPQGPPYMSTRVPTNLQPPAPAPMRERVPTNLQPPALNPRDQLTPIVGNQVGSFGTFTPEDAFAQMEQAFKRGDMKTYNFWAKIAEQKMQGPNTQSQAITNLLKLGALGTGAGAAGMTLSGLAPERR